MPSILMPRKGRYGLIDYEKIFCASLADGQDIFDLRGIDRTNGCVVVVRPDQYIANVLPLNGYEELSKYFSSFLVTPELEHSCETQTGMDTLAMNRT